MMSWQLVPFDDAELTPEEQAQVAAMERMLNAMDWRLRNDELAR